MPFRDAQWRLRGRIGADLAVFDPRTFIDGATVEQPQAVASAMCNVYGNGVAVVRDGGSTGAKIGKFDGGPDRMRRADGSACGKTRKK